MRCCCCASSSFNADENHMFYVSCEHEIGFKCERYNLNVYSPHFCFSSISLCDILYRRSVLKCRRIQSQYFTVFFSNWIIGNAIKLQWIDQREREKCCRWHPVLSLKDIKLTQIYTQLNVIEAFYPLARSLTKPAACAQARPLAIAMSWKSFAHLWMCSCVRFFHKAFSLLLTFTTVDGVLQRYP